MPLTLLLGSTGLLGQSMRTLLASFPDQKIVGVARRNADIQVDISNPQSLWDLLLEIDPDEVINCAALTNIDQCESDKIAAWASNARPLQILSDWSVQTGRPVMHVSTDHFFFGEGDKRHKEDDPVTLLHEYASSKYGGELFALKSPNTLVIRTSIVGFRGWANQTFLEWAWDVVESDLEANLFSDAYTSSIDAKSLAELSIELFRKGARGLYNLGSKEVYSKADFVKELSNQLDKPLTRAKIGSIRGSKINSGDSLGLEIQKATQLLTAEPPSMREIVASLVEIKRRDRESS